MSREQFEEVVAQALDDLPEELAQQIDNVFVQVEDEPSAEDLAGLDLDPEEDTLFGLYQGVSILERDPSNYGSLPDRIVIYRLPLLEACASRRELRREIRDTVVHELGHYFGLDEDALP